MFNKPKPLLHQNFSYSYSLPQKGFEKKVQFSYGSTSQNWGDLDIFAGGYINFGYWHGIELTKPVTLGERKLSSYNLYQHTLKILNPSLTDTIIEIGSGRGVGLIESFSCSSSNKLVGIDLTQAQIARAVAYAKASPVDTSCIQFIQSSAYSLPADPQSVDKIYSVEVLQHIQDFQALASEFKRVLKPGGNFAFVAHLATSEATNKSLKDYGLLISDIEVLAGIDTIKSAFEDEGFNVQCDSIGKEVFKGYEAWVNQLHPEDTDTNKIFDAYMGGYIDYFACNFTAVI